jgi:hypothetical protein
MKPITLKEALLIYVDAVLVDGPAPLLYLKDGDNHYHNVDEIDLIRDRMCCDDGYWDYYEFVLEAEGREDHTLFIKEN